MPLSKSKIKPEHNSGQDASFYSFSFDAIGTRWSINFEQSINEAFADQLRQDIYNRIEAFDQAYSRFRSDSLVTAMSHRLGNFQLPDDAKPLIDFYQQIHEISGGLVTPLVGQLLSDAGYDSEYSLSPKPLRPIPGWSEALTYSFPNLRIKKLILLDFGAAGKGYLVDIVSCLIKSTGIHNFCINAGGDILNCGVSGDLSKIGLEHPLYLDEIIGVATLPNGSICGSAINRRAWAGYNHLMDPRTGRSPNHILATWVTADTAMIADGMATALFFTEAATLSRHYNFEYALLGHDLALEHSDNFPADFFLLGESHN